MTGQIAWPPAQTLRGSNASLSPIREAAESLKPASLSALRQYTVTDDVYRVLRDHIVNSTFVPGQRLQVAELAQQLGISRTPVKDALNQLAGEGLIKIIPRRGTFVADLSVDEILETYEVRRALELAAGERLIQTLTPEGLAALQSLLREAESLEVPHGGEDRLVEQHLRANADFHELFVQLAGNRKLLEAYRGLHASIQIALIHYRSPEWRQRLSQERSEHRAILSALQAQDSAAVAQAIKTHLDRAKQSLVDDMRAWAATRRVAAAGKDGGDE